jgi:hypothetical protein
MLFEPGDVRQRHPPASLHPSHCHATDRFEQVRFAAGLQQPPENDMNEICSLSRLAKNDSKYLP